MMISRSVYHYQARRRDQTPLVNRIKEIAAARVRYGYQRVHILLRREGWLVNRKRLYRLYRLEGLSLFQRRPRRHRSAMQRNRVLSRNTNDDGTRMTAWARHHRCYRFC